MSRILLIYFRWVENKSAQANERMNMLVKSLLLRRTKVAFSQILKEFLLLRKRLKSCSETSWSNFPYYWN